MSKQYKIQHMDSTGELVSEPIRFIPIGDSLTIGHGVRPGECWPYLLVNNLRKEGLDITMPHNPARSGFTSQQALEVEVPILESSNPTFSAILIGSNDMSRGVELVRFQANFCTILDRVQKALPDPKKVIVMNLPDFTATPAALKYQGQLHLEPYMLGFKLVIEKEAQIRDLPLVDLYSITQKLGPKRELYGWDGLHPSAKGYAELERHIRPVALNLLKSR